MLSLVIRFVIVHFCKMSDSFQRLDDFIQSGALLIVENKLLLAVSGGMDSMFMSRYFLDRGYTFGIAHCNFGLRGAESDADEALVREFCIKNDIPFYVNHFKTEAFSIEKGISIQMAARELRYQWFSQLCDENNYVHLVTAHHSTDHVETVVLNQLRGAGLTGHEGIKVRSGNKVRPLLCLSRNEIEQAVKVLEIPYREDTSNQSDKYFRNRIRHHILPQFAKINPSFEKTFFQNSQYVKQGNTFIAHFMETIKKDILSISAIGIIIDTQKLINWPEPEFILHHILHPFQFNSAQITDIYNSIGSISGKIFYTRDYRLVTQTNQWVLEKMSNCIKEEYTITKDTNKLSTENYLWQFETNQSKVIERDKNTACFDLEKLHFPLKIRTWNQGDKIKPLGMSGHKKISDILIDRKLSISQKDKTLVLVSGQDIIWVTGIQINEDFKVTPNTSKIYKVVLKPKTNSQS